jgi:arylsulfatase A-like enzyme
VGIPLLVFLLVVSACAPQDEPNPSSSAPDKAPAPRHLILISVDTLRADHMSLYGYQRATTPALDRRSEAGTVFERAIAHWPKTGASFASMFLGSYPQTTGLTHKAALRLPESARTLPALLSQQGFRSFAVVSNPVLSPDLGWDRGFERYLVTWTGEMSNDPYHYRPMLNAERVNQLALPLIEELSQTPDRTFLWLHYSDPHAPYILPTGISNPFLGDDLYAEQVATEPPPVDLAGTQGREIPGETELPFYIAQYDANILVADRAIDQTLDALSRAGVLEHSLVILVSDHGESLFEHGLFFEHGPLPYNTTSRVPLVIWSPGSAERRQTRRVEQAVELVDLLPTIVEALLPAAILPQLDGDSLWPLIQPRPSSNADRRDPEADEPAIAFAESGRPPRHDRFVQDQGWKLIWRPPARDLELLADGLTLDELSGHLEFYNLSRDPTERVDLAALSARPDALDTATGEIWTDQDQQAFERLSRELIEKSRALPLREESDEALGSDVEKALEALGYIEELAPAKEGTIR